MTNLVKNVFLAECEDVIDILKDIKLVKDQKIVKAVKNIVDQI